jgi:GT2 family glycosyltransferase
LPLKVSIITVYYNTPSELSDLRVSMRRHLKEEDYEWILIDNHSETDLSSNFPEAIYCRQMQNLGFARACNLGAERASTSYLFFVNPDCEFTQDCLDPLLNAVEKGGVAGPRVLNADGSIQLSFGRFLSVGAEALQKFRMQFEKTALMQKWLARKFPFHPDYVSGCALMIRAETFRSLHGFDPTFFLYNEDVDLCKRVRSQGLDVTYVPSAVIVHKRNRSVNKNPDLSLREYRKSQIYYYSKHHGRLQNFLLKLYLSLAGKSPKALPQMKEVRSSHES